jgi:hypothetical protein
VNGRILRVELRRSAAPVTAAIVLLLMLVQLVGLGGPAVRYPTAYNEQWTSLAAAQRQTLMLLWPLVLAAGALQGRREQRSRVVELLGTTPRPNRERVRPTAVALALWLTGSYLLVLVIGAVQVAGNVSYFSAGWIFLELVGVLVLVSGGLLGLGLGRLAPSALTPALLAVAGVGALIATSLASPIGRGHGSLPVALLGPSLDEILPGSDVFTTATPAVDAGQALWFGGLAVGGLVLLAADRPLTRLAAVLPVVVGLVAALLVLPSDVQQAYRTDYPAAELVCASGTPAVCLSRAHQNQLAALAGPARQALGELAALPDPPTVVAEDTRTALGLSRAPLPRTDEVVLQLDGLDFDDGQVPLSPQQLQLGVLAAATEPVCRFSDLPYGPPAQPSPEVQQTGYLHARTAQAVAASWFLGRLTYLPNESAFRPRIEAAERTAWDRLRALPLTVQRSRIAAVRTAAATCHGDLLTALGTGTGSA